MCEVYHRAESPAWDSFISRRGHYWKREIVVHDFHHLSNQWPIHAKILEGQRKLVIVISHLSQTRHRGAKRDFLGGSMRASKIKDHLCTFGGHLQLGDRCLV